MFDALASLDRTAFASSACDRPSAIHSFWRIRFRPQCRPVPAKWVNRRRWMHSVSAYDRLRNPFPRKGRSSLRHRSITHPPYSVAAGGATAADGEILQNRNLLAVWIAVL